MSESEAPAEKRGRPRPEATIQRDDKVLEFLKANGPKNRKDLAAGLEMEGKEVYLSLYRLNRDGTILRSGANWGGQGRGRAAHRCAGSG
jgi:predicted ArsR family transcriptional regulator